MIKWSKKEDRKPLILRGARQVGKTTLVKLFAKRFDDYIYLNLDEDKDKQLFLKYEDIDDLVNAIFFSKNQVKESSSILIFIDEIQEVPKALSQLRYFYEKYPDIHVIAAGSLLETLFNKEVSFPVGRVEYLPIRPVSFEEFLGAMGEDTLIDALSNLPLSEYAYDKAFDLFHTYVLIGGMPEIVQKFSKTNDFAELSPIYESLLTGYLEDVEKYAKNDTMVQVLRHLIETSLVNGGKRIKFEGFGNSNYRSREVGEGFRTLERAFILRLVYPTTSIQLPVQTNKRKSPRLQLLDTGMMNYFSGIQQDLLGVKDLNKEYKGTIIEHVVGQELLAHDERILAKLNFWVRDKKGSTAEIDYLFNYKGMLVPIEVKSGKVGKLRSLNLYMDKVEHNFAVRLYAGKLDLQATKTIEGKPFYLLNLPYFLVYQLKNYLGWMETEIAKM